MALLHVDSLPSSLLRDKSAVHTLFFLWKGDSFFWFLLSAKLSSRVVIKDSLKLAVHETAEDEDGSAVEKAFLEAVKLAPCVLVLHNLGAALAMAPQPPTAALASGPVKSKAKSPFEAALAAILEHRLYASASPR